MSKAATPSRWFSAWRPAQRTQQNDPADLGTAFGLDMSLLEDAAAAPTANQPERSEAGWVQRLGWRRHKPQA